MHSRNYKIKAAFLLFVFALNTVVSFACSASGVLHRLHHHDEKQSASHQHGKPQNGHDHKENPSHKHDGKHQHSNKSEKENDDCCSNSVVSLQKMDKSPTRSIEAPNAAFLTAFVLTYLSISPQNIQANTFFPDHLRWRLTTTIQDLRIVIQSFQI